MSNSLQSLMKSGTKLWLDSVDPDLVLKNRKLGATGATSNPVIIESLIRTGKFDATLAMLLKTGISADEATWALTDRIVSQAEEVFSSVYKDSKGNDGYVSFELDPLLEDPQGLGASLPLAERVKRYTELGKKWSAGHPNRMIKVPATEAGIAALEHLAAAGVPLNVTLIFTASQYRKARESVWRGAQKLKDKSQFKSVYSIFVSRLDVYTEKNAASLSKEAQGQVGIVNAKLIWRENETYWQAHKLPLKQEMVFASTGVKDPAIKAWKYVEALAGSDIQTNPPSTNDAADLSGVTFTSQLSQMPSAEIISEIDEKVDMQKLEDFLIADGVAKFVAPQKALLALVKEKKTSLKA